MRLSRSRRSAVLSTAMSSALGLVSLQACDLDRSSVGGPNSTIDNPASDASDASLATGPDDASAISLADASSLPGEGTADAMTVGSSLPPGSCDLTGQFAVQIEAQVKWQGSTLFDIVPIILPGTGKLSVVVTADLSEENGQRSAKIRACGATTPDFSSSVSETYSVAFPDEVWEKLALRWATPVTTACIMPGCAIDTEHVVAQLGIGIPDSAVWPTSRDPLDVSSLRDDDGDGIPGVLLRARGPKDPGGAKYSHPPSNLLLTQRISELMLAIRIGATLHGQLDSCDEFSGTVPDMTIDTRALACVLDSGVRCASDDVGFLDDNLPVWVVSDAKYKAVRLPATAGCSDARAAMP